MSEDAGVFLLSRRLRQRCRGKNLEFDGCARAAVGNFAITSPSFSPKGWAKSLLRYGVRKNVLDFSTTFALGAGIFVFALAEAG